jgi:cell division protein FtsB
MKIIGSKFLTIGILALLLWLGVSVLNLRAKKDMLEKEIYGYSSKIEQIKKNNGELREFLSFFNIPGFLERQARIKLNYKAPEEQVVYVYRDDSIPSVESTDNFIENLPNYKKWWYYLLGY